MYVRKGEKVSSKVRTDNGISAVISSLIIGG